MDSKSFTLIELVIVISILAIIAAVAIPKFVNLQNKALDAQEHATIGAMRSAINLEHAKRYLDGESQPWPDGTGFEDGSWNPFRDLDNSPPNARFGTQAPGNGRYWVWARLDTHWRIWCPHAITSSPYPGYEWSYMLQTGIDSWGSEIHSAGSIVQVEWYIGHQ